MNILELESSGTLQRVSPLCEDPLPCFSQVLVFKAFLKCTFLQIPYTQENILDVLAL